MSAIRWVVVTFLVMTASQALAQSSSPFVPVTDEVLQDPDPADWLMWRRTLDGWGYSPLEQIDRDNVGELRMVWTRALAPGLQQGTPLVHDGVMYMPNPRDVIQALDGASGDLLWEYRRSLPDDVDEFPHHRPRRGQPQSRHLRRPHHRHQRRRLRLRPRRRDGPAGLGDADPRLPDAPRQSDLRPHHRRRKDHLGAELRPRRWSRGVRHHRPRCPDRRGAVAHAHHSRARRAGGDESWGDVPYEERKHVGAWMVPSYDPALNLIYIGTSVTSPAPKFMLGGTDKKHLYHNSTLALDADTGEIVWYYPAPERPLGSRSPVRAPAARHRRRAGSGGRAVDQPPAAARRGPQGRDRDSRQDRHRLYPRPRDRRVPVGDADGHPERDQRHRRRHRRGSPRTPRSSSRATDRRCWPARRWWAARTGRRGPTAR